jgi:hypothetical protein
MTKRRVVVDVDEDLLDAVDDLGVADLSDFMADALREAVELKLHQRALAAWLDERFEAFGPPSPEAMERAREAFAELDRPAPADTAGST